MSRGPLMTAWPGSGIDVLMGIGGTPEGVLAACALRAMGGEIQGKRTCERAGAEARARDGLRFRQAADHG